MKSEVLVGFNTLLVVLVLSVGLSNVERTTASPTDFEAEPLGEGEAPRNKRKRNVIIGLFDCSGIQWWWCPATTTAPTTTSKPQSRTTTTLTTATTTKLTTTTAASPW